MYIRKKEVVDQKTGNRYAYYRLVESVAGEGTVKQRTILYLGKLDLSKDQLKTLAKLIENRIYGKRETITLPELSELADKFYEKYKQKLEKAAEKEARHEAAEYRSVDLNCVTTERHRSYGSEFVLNAFWRKLGMHKILQDAGFSGKDIAIAKGLISGRIISPGSELHTYLWYQNRSSLNDFSKYDLSSTGKDSFYTVGDLLYNCKSKIETRLRTNIRREYSFQDSIYLYDLTNTYFEGNKSNSQLARHGKSKEKRSDCPLVTLALVVDCLGFPIYSEIYQGNQSEPETLEDILNKVIKKSHSDVVKAPRYSIIIDRGIATSANIDYLKKNNYSYFVIERRNSVKDYKKEFSEKSSFTSYPVSNKNTIHLRKIEQDDNIQVLVYSSGKEKKERAIMDKKADRFIEDAGRLIKSNHKRSIVQIDKINQRIGRLCERYGAIASGYTFNLERDANNPNRVISISLDEKPKKKPIKDEYAGCYVIETDQKNYSAKEIWDMYMQLHHVEAAFRSLKSELGTRPIYHQKDERIKAHIFISVIAYSILHSVEYELEKAGIHKSWSSINKILSTHQRSTVILESEDDKKYRIRVSSTPEICHQEIYDKLNLKFSPNPKKKKVSMR